jgi:hypothetical protein
VISAATGSNFLECGAPNVFRSGGVLAKGQNSPVQTLLLSPNGSSFAVQAAQGWVTQSDGDIGNSANFGFYHQELRADGGGITNLALSDKFKLPEGTVCGFHHTQNTPFQMLLGEPKATCMGQDPASRQCPKGWVAKSHFDMSSGDGTQQCGDLQNQSHCGYFTWCEYQDPNKLCGSDPQCIASARAHGYAVGISSNTDACGVECGGSLSEAPCPVGFSRTRSFDDGRSAGSGLSWCLPIPDLPQGLTAGLAYYKAPIVAFGGAAYDGTTPFTNGDGFAIRSDGDIGASSGAGFYHQELVSGGLSDLSKSASLKLLPGTACGFHQTHNSPGLTCMGLDPAANQCPNGWVARSQFDMSSGDGQAQCGNGQNQEHCHYFVWCEYQDPKSQCAGSNLTECIANAKYIGYVTSISSNVESSGQAAFVCPTGWTRSPSFDNGRPSGKGLSWCQH